MFKRLLIGLFTGGLLGAIVAAICVKGLGLVTFAGGMSGAAMAYAAAAVAGILTGLVAGKPIWSSGGQIEAGLKAFFGALLSAGAMFALQRWVPLTVDLGVIGAGSGAIGQLPAVSLPLIAGVLGGFYEADNTSDEGGDAKGKGAPAAKGKVATKEKVRVAEPDDEEVEEEERPAKGKKRR